MGKPPTYICQETHIDMEIFGGAGRARTDDPRIMRTSDMDLPRFGYVFLSISLLNFMSL